MTSRCSITQKLLDYHSGKCLIKPGCISITLSNPKNKVSLHAGFFSFFFFLFLFLNHARRYLSRYMARGAAALGANCQPGFDAVYPYLYDDIVLNPKKVGFIIVQVKNDSNAHRHVDIFPNMDPFKCGLLSEEDLEDGIFPIPIIRLLFSLSAKGTPTVQMHETPTVGEGRPTFTSYDYVCSGVSEHILQPVGESPDVWTSLVNRSDPWDSFYSVPTPDVLRSQLPGCGTDEGHWKNWAESF